MSLKEQLENRKTKLKPTKTKITTADGKVFIEDKDSLQEVKINILLHCIFFHNSIFSSLKCKL